MRILCHVEVISARYTTIYFSSLRGHTQRKSARQGLLTRKILLNKPTAAIMHYDNYKPSFCQNSLKNDAKFYVNKNCLQHRGLTEDHLIIRAY